ncbi:MAG: RIP metalloprotease RseP, partial [candidate division NC10 bacterium]
MTILTAAVVLGVLIFVHELGHFLVAKRSGVGVLKFSLGFGPKLIGIKRGETEYLLSAFPLGGYVKMIGEDPGDESAEAADPKRSFSRKGVGTRARIILAGPAANLLLPVAIFWGIFTFAGQPYFLPIVGTPEKDSPAAQAGLAAGDEVKALDGRPIARWEEIKAAVQASSGRALRLTLVRSGQTVEMSVTPRAMKTRDVFGQEIEAWDLGLHPLLSTRIGQVLPGQVAQQAGLQIRDRIVALD